MTSVAFSSGGQRIVTGSEDSSVKVWDVACSQQVLTLRGHRGGVAGVGFSSDGQRLFSRDENGNPLIWQTRTGQLIADAIWLDSVQLQKEALSPDGKWKVHIEGANIILRPHGRPTQLEQVERQRLADWTRPNLNWHVEQAQQAEKAQQWFAAAFHHGKVADVQPWDFESRLEEARLWVQAEQPERAALAFVQATLFPVIFAPPPNNLTEE